MAVSLTNVEKNKRDGIRVLTAQFSLMHATGKRRRVNVALFSFGDKFVSVQVYRMTTSTTIRAKVKRRFFFFGGGGGIGAITWAGRSPT